MALKLPTYYFRIQYAICFLMMFSVSKMHSLTYHDATLSLAPPTATITLSDSDIISGESPSVTIVFSEIVLGFDNTDVVVPNGQLSTLNTNDGGITFTATYTPNNDVDDTTNIFLLDNTGVTDASNTPGIGTSSSANFIIDTRPPNATITINDDTLSIGETSLITITFTEAVTGFDNADITVPNGSLSDVVSTDGEITFTATYTPNSNIEDLINTISVNKSGLTDNKGNSGSGSANSDNLSIDTRRPTVAISISDTEILAGNTTTITFTFSEIVTDFSNTDLTIPASGALSNVISTNGNSVFTAVFTPTANLEDLTNIVSIDNSGINDMSGNAGVNTIDSGNFIIDTAIPQSSIIIDDTAINIGETALVTILFSEAVTGFDNSDLTIANGTLSPVTSTDGNISFTATYTPNITVEAATNSISIDNSRVEDTRGNTGTGIINSNNFAVDTERPTVMVSIQDTEIMIGDTSLITFTFSEVINGFDNSDLTFSNGSLSDVTSTDGGITYTATFTPTNGIEVNNNAFTILLTGVDDQNGNSGISTYTSGVFSVDTLAPIATLSSTASSTTGENPIPVRITFPEVVSGFDMSDISVTNGTISNFTETTTGLLFDIEITPASNGIITLNIASGIALDLNNNENIMSSEFSITYDSTLSSEDFFIENGFALYPNPNRGAFSIRGNYSLGLQNFAIFTTQGKLIKKQSFNKNQQLHQINISEVPSGIYFIKIDSDKGSITKKLIKQ